LAVSPDKLPTLERLTLTIGPVPTPHPLPNLLRPLLVGVDDDVFTGGLGDFSVDVRSDVVVGDAAIASGFADERSEASLLGEPLERQFPVLRGNLERRLVAIPAQDFDEEGIEVEGVE
jgi:hypothetical protein